MGKKGGKRHSAEQIVRKLRDAEAMLTAGKTIGEACQSLEVSEQTFHRWRQQYGGKLGATHEFDGGGQVPAV
jgi:putative transposase